MIKTGPISMKPLTYKVKRDNLTTRRRVVGRGQHPQRLEDVSQSRNGQGNSTPIKYSPTPPMKSHFRDPLSREEVGV
jgi:hypothetical protein